MSSKFNPPSDAFGHELQEVAKQASNLANYLGTANRLPEGFPRDPVNDLCRALIGLPGGSAQGAVFTLVYARERLLDFRPPLRGDDEDDAQIFRGEELDNKMTALDAAVGSAISHYRKETGVEISVSDDKDITAAKTPEDDLKLGGVSETARKTKHEIAAARQGLEKEALEDEEAADAVRGMRDAENQLNIGGAEAGVESPKAQHLEKIGKKLVDGAEKLGEILEHAKEIGRPWADGWGQFQADALQTVFNTISYVGKALKGSARYIRSIQTTKDLPPSTSSTPPPNFDLVKAYEMILRGETPPEGWHPFITELNLEEEEIYDLTPLSPLSALHSLDLNETQVRDLAPLSKLTALRSLFLNETEVSDLTPLAALTSLKELYLDGAQISDLTPLSSLPSLEILYLDYTAVNDLKPLTLSASLQELSLDGTQISDLTPLTKLTSLKRLFLNNTQVNDLSPLANLTSLEGLFLRDTMVSDLTPLAKLTSLGWLRLDNTQVYDLSPLANLVALKDLHLSNTQVNDLSPLGNLKNLSYLGIKNAPIRDISPVKDIKGLLIIN